MNANLDAVLRLTRQLADRPAARDRSDRDLLERFRADGDETAFAVLVERHGPLVLNLCRRLLGNSHDADDVFQATFLILARNAGSIRNTDSLSGWLCGVARRIAHKARLRAQSRRDHERQARPIQEHDPGDEVTWQELCAILDEEIARLPETYRAPLVLCLMHGKTQEAAAGELSCPKSTLASRLEKAREVLRQRLERRGITLTAGALTAILAERSAAALLPARLLLAAVRSTTQPTSVPAGVLTLAEGAAPGTGWAGWKLVVGALVGTALLMGAVVGAVLVTRPTPVPTVNGAGPDGGGGPAPTPAPDVAEMVRDVLDGKIDRRLVCLEVSYGGQVPEEKGTARVYGNGPGAWGPTGGFEQPFTLTDEQLTALLKKLHTSGFGKMPGKIEAGKLPVIQPDPFKLGYLGASLRIQNVRKVVGFSLPPGQSIYKPDPVPEAESLVELARDLRQMVLKATEKSTAVAKMEDGLRKIVKKELAPEYLHFVLQYSKELPADPEQKPAVVQPGAETVPINTPRESWTLGIQGPFVSVRRQASRNRKDTIQEAELVLSREEVVELAQLFLDTELAGLAQDYDNLGPTGGRLTSSDDKEAGKLFLQLDIAVVQPRVKRVILGPAFKLTPAYQKTFNRLLDQLEQVTQRALKQGQPKVFIGG